MFFMEDIQQQHRQAPARPLCSGGQAKTERHQGFARDLSPHYWSGRLVLNFDVLMGIDVFTNV